MRLDIEGMLVPGWEVLEISLSSLEGLEGQS